MTPEQIGFLSGFAGLNAGLFLLGCWQSFGKKNSYGITWFFIPLGIFVWGDAIIYSLFWAAAAVLALTWNDWVFFWLIVAVFAAVRGLGETIFWIHHQFSGKQIYPAESLPGYKLVKNESIWFIYQIIAQCVTVAGIAAAVYLGKIILNG